ncbi:hypothetical protein [Epilithonimonas xixisoli]|uniref:Uncharacterized protein n=1 Tax=Epilithonimonas xixisoli TaxID=1476462 RepID=A0A4R8IJ48_9FLAO|nr:hypothetical protein [Epilithonimonas xixisoli]TDX87003.1 hypothetical protein B0I22_1170 [Epilithonimonas xixisoli]
MKVIRLIIFLLFPVHYFAQINLDKYAIDDDGITVEKPEAGKNYDENYNYNNIIYKIGKSLTYSYFYQNVKGEKFLIKQGKEIQLPGAHSRYDWEFVNFDRQDNETVKHLILKPSSGNPFGKEIPDYNQTAIGYEYIMNNGQFLTMEMTGAIENEMNVWIHPPRSNFFKILELNPFPYIKAPYQIGTKWNWKLEIGDHWADKRWLEWKGGIENNYDYEIKEKKNIATKLGNLECYIIHSKAKSRIGETELISYFNPNFGFVKLEYKNIDGTKTILELEKVE